MDHLDHLKMMTDWSTDPPITETELEDMLSDAARTDADGNSPSTDSWTPTYDMNSAIADAWMIKAARAAALTEVDPPGSGIVTSKVFDNCVKMARSYGSRRKRSVKF